MSMGSCRACSSATERTSLLGSIAITDSVPGSLASASARIPPPQPMSRKRSFWVLSALCTSTDGSEFSGDVRAEEVSSIGEPLRRQRWIKERRIGFIRCRRREEPWGSHHAEARFAKCEISVWSTELVEWALMELVLSFERRISEGRTRWRGGIFEDIGLVGWSITAGDVSLKGTTGR